MKKNRNQQLLQNEPVQINKDRNDLNELREQINQLDRIKIRYNSQEKEIKQLTKKVFSLQNQNQQLKIHSHIDELSQPELQNNIILGKNLMSRSRMTQGETLSPKRQEINQRIKKQLYYQMKPIARTKRNLISGFVEQLRDELEENYNVIRKERKAHLSTKRKLSECQGQIHLLQSQLKKNEYYSAVMKENENLKISLQQQHEKNMRIEADLTESRKLIKIYERNFMSSNSKYQKQLKKMDHIYLAIQSDITSI